MTHPIPHSNTTPLQPPPQTHHTYPPPFYTPHHGPQPNLSPSNNQFQQPIPQPQPPKLQLISFDGSKPLDYILQAEQLFQLYLVPPKHQKSMISFYIQGEAFSWFKLMFHNSQLLDWQLFTRALENCFGSSTYINHQAELFKPDQIGTVAKYRKQFEKLSNRIWGLSHEIILNCFISGLIPKIRCELTILRPTSISDDLGLAKLVEAKIHYSTRRFPRFDHIIEPTPTTQVPEPQNRSPTPTHTPSLLIRRLTLAQMQDWRAQGLCNKCNERYHHGHRYQPMKFLLMLDDCRPVQLEAELTCLVSSNDIPLPTDPKPLVEDLIHINHYIG
ncbi:unnamed protein product [Lupinus luteus]|uniref:Retrotransposon gag domain-containing protein n=1 Tax=Lupinus luteus TaxID=3873 RepID=A0AAV1Y631_LUPLU